MPHTETASQWLMQLLKLMGYPSSVIAEPNPIINATKNATEEGEICCLVIDHADLHPHQIQALIGIDGVNIDSIQYLANLTLNAHLASESAHCFYVVELNKYRANRQIELQQIANLASSQVRETQKEYEIENLSAADRRQVHMLLKQHPDLETFSQGKEPNRHLIVRLLQT